MKQFSDCPFKACFKQMCFNLKPQEYIDNNLFVNSVFNFFMRHCQGIFFSNLYKTSNDQFKTLHKILQFSNLCMPFTICLVFQDGQNKFGRSCSLLYHYFINPFLYSDNEDDHEKYEIGNLV